MAIRLSFDVIGSTCGDLLRFAEAVRAAGVQPETPLQQAGPNRIEVADDRGGPAPHPGPPPRPAGPRFTQGFTMSGSFGHPRPSHGPEEGCSIQIRRDSTTHGAHVSIETVDRWRAALDVLLGSADVDEPTRASLFHLRHIFSAEPGGS
jgi:hypothetical protein